MDKDEFNKRCKTRFQGLRNLERQIREIENEKLCPEKIEAYLAIHRSLTRIVIETTNDLLAYSSAHPEDDQYVEHLDEWFEELDALYDSEAKCFAGDDADFLDDIDYYEDEEDGEGEYGFGGDWWKKPHYSDN